MQVPEISTGAESVVEFCLRCIIYKCSKTWSFSFPSFSFTFLASSARVNLS